MTHGRTSTLCPLASLCISYRTYRFVSYDSPAAANVALVNMDGFPLGKKRLKVAHKNERGNDSVEGAGVYGGQGSTYSSSTLSQSSNSYGGGGMDGNDHHTYDQWQQHPQHQVRRLLHIQARRPLIPCGSVGPCPACPFLVVCSSYLITLAAAAGLSGGRNRGHSSSSSSIRLLYRPATGMVAGYRICLIPAMCRSKCTRRRMPTRTAHLPRCPLTHVVKPPRRSSNLFHNSIGECLGRCRRGVVSLAAGSNTVVDSHLERPIILYSRSCSSTGPAKDRLRRLTVTLPNLH